MAHRFAPTTQRATRRPGIRDDWLEKSPFPNNPISAESMRVKNASAWATATFLGAALPGIDHAGVSSATAWCGPPVDRHS